VPGQPPARRIRQNPWLIDSAVGAALLIAMLLSIATKAALPGQQPNTAIRAPGWAPSSSDWPPEPDC